MVTKHTHQVVFGRRVDGCPRCTELDNGAKPVQWSISSRRERDEHAIRFSSGERIAESESAEEDATMETSYEMAIHGLDVARSAGIVRVRDGHDTWLCRAGDWDAAVDDVSASCAPEDQGDAYTALCHCVRRRGPIASINGVSRGDWESLVRRAYEAELIDAEDAHAFGIAVEVQS